MFGLADCEVNRGRQPEIDGLKAFCVFFMILLRRILKGFAEYEKSKQEKEES